MTNDVPKKGGKGQSPTASRPDASSDEQPAMRVRCIESDWDHDQTHTAETRHMALSRAMMASATHEHATTRTIDDEDVDTRVTVTGPGSENIHVGGQR